MSISYAALLDLAEAGDLFDMYDHIDRDAGLMFRIGESGIGDFIDIPGRLDILDINRRS